MTVRGNDTIQVGRSEWDSVMATLDRKADRIALLEAENARLVAENAELRAKKSPNRVRIEQLMKDGIPRTKITIAKACFPGHSDKQSVAMLAHQMKKLIDAGRLREVSPRVWVWIP